MHLFHVCGAVSSLGFTPALHGERELKTGAKIFAILIAIGNISIPIRRMAGLCGEEKTDAHGMNRNLRTDR